MIRPGAQARGDVLRKLDFELPGDLVLDFVADPDPGVAIVRVAFEWVEGQVFIDRGFEGFVHTNGVV
ncbi:MAG: hypothetical protein GWN58_60290 [Anaerolineae bacterium]|nr:hypothetical protein [Anaerolineae bacterium]